MASWCCPHVSSGEVQPSVYVLTSYGRMAARRRSARVPACTSCCLPSAKTERGASRARPSRRVVRSRDVSRRVMGSISPRIRRSMSELDFREELVSLSRLAHQPRCIRGLDFTAEAFLHTVPRRRRIDSSAPQRTLVSDTPLTTPKPSSQRSA